MVAAGAGDDDVCGDGCGGGGVVWSGIGEARSGDGGADRKSSGVGDEDGASDGEDGASGDEEGASGDADAEAVAAGDGATGGAGCDTPANTANAKTTETSGAIT